MRKRSTLEQGLAEFQMKNSAYFSDRPMSDEARRFLRSHDIAHVIFGCDTSIYGEGVVKIWTTFGSDLSFREVSRGYRAAKAFMLFKEYHLKHQFKHFIRLLLAIPKTIRRARQMSRPWCWSDYEPYLHTPIDDIRREFNIRVID